MNYSKELGLHVQDDYVGIQQIDDKYHLYHVTEHGPLIINTNPIGYHEIPTYIVEQLEADMSPEKIAFIHLFSELECPKYTFENWMTDVDAVLHAEIMMTHEYLPDWCWRTDYDSGTSAKESAEVYLESLQAGELW